MQTLDIPDGKFPWRIALCLYQMGDEDFGSPAAVPVLNTGRKVAKHRVFRRYLSAQDIVYAMWLYRRAERNPAGLAYLNSLLDKRSGGRWKDEWDVLTRALPEVVAPSTPNALLSQRQSRGPNSLRTTFRWEYKYQRPQVYAFPGPESPAST
jgi:hypothetical protein